MKDIINIKLLEPRASIVLENDKGKICVEKKPLHYFKNLSLIGGTIEYNETPLFAAYRELFEELGIMTKLFYVGKYISAMRMIYLFTGRLSNDKLIKENSLNIIFITPEEYLQKALYPPEEILLKTLNKMHMINNCSD